MTQIPKDTARRNHDWAMFEGLAYLSTAALATAAVWWLLTWFSEWARMPAAGRFYAAPFIWMFPALTLGLFAGGIIVPAVFKRCLGQHYAELQIYENAVAGDNQIRANKWILGILPLAAVIMAVQIWNFHAFFENGKIEIREFIDLSSRTYSYSEVTDIVTSLYTKAPNGDLVYGRDYQIHFRDARRWGTHSNGYGLDDRQKQEIALYVSMKSGRAIRELKTIP